MKDFHEQSHTESQERTLAPNSPDNRPTATTGASKAEREPGSGLSYDEYEAARYEAADPPASARSAPPLPVPGPVARSSEKPAPSGSTKSGNVPPPRDPPKSSSGDGEEDEEEELLRMSFMEHLEELRARILKALAGVGIAFLFSIIFANDLWRIVSEPAVDALIQLGYENPKLAQIKPMETFTTVWVKLPMLTAIFLASPWILYQAWAFVAPGLYRRERRWAAPIIICSAGLFILGGLFAYFVAFRYGLAFLLGIGRDINIQPVVSVTEYFDLFVNVTLGIGLIFELPVLIFFLIMLRLVTPGFLLRNARYAILIIAIIAAIITPTPDVVNMMLFCVPMWLLYFVGVFAGYLLELHRQGRVFPWRKLGWGSLVVLLVVAAGVIWAITRGGYHLEWGWPPLVR